MRAVASVFSASGAWVAAILCARVVAAAAVGSGGVWVTANLVGRTGSVPGKLNGGVLPETAVLVHGTDSRVRGVSVRKDGTFEILQLPAPGEYTLSVTNALDYYSDVRVVLDSTGGVERVLVVESKLGRSVKQQSAKIRNKYDTVVFEPLAPVTYEVQQQSMNGIIQYLKKPIVILVLFVAIIMLILPNFADSMDPETYAELFGDRRPHPGRPADVYMAVMGLAQPGDGGKRLASSRAPCLDDSMAARPQAISQQSQQQQQHHPQQARRRKSAKQRA
ncbi:hypothetical protein FVE85_7355 [Porphyridium purpureum]|uniref:ER membrane protein complex subunit 7 beta-sandwich domain-containing protein n=1 Tax=Porphyridium purpureum TaxID=35688 RepID=A0A5J4Z9G7_PORPP|nr:hypothetical protein FVE85_7355 [Porphyridium purpureum]|eukprot:POR1706..scf295_1